MPHKRSKAGRERAHLSYLKRLQHEQDQYDRQLLYIIESKNIWNYAYFDDELDEIINTIVCHQQPIEKGEVLIDSRNRGFFQRLK